MKDGHLNQCKVCRKEYMKVYGAKNKEKLSEKSKSTSKQQKFLEKTIQTHVFLI